MANGTRVLVTDDDDAVRGVMLRVLTPRGGDVREACHRSPAPTPWPVAEVTMSIDLLSTDQAMRGGSGSARVGHLATPFNTTPVRERVGSLRRGARGGVRGGAGAEVS